MIRRYSIIGRVAAMGGLSLALAGAFAAPVPGAMQSVQGTVTGHLAVGQADASTYDRVAPGTVSVPENVRTISLDSPAAVTIEAGSTVLLRFVPDKYDYYSFETEGADYSELALYFAGWDGTATSAGRVDWRYVHPSRILAEEGVDAKIVRSLYRGATYYLACTLSNLSPTESNRSGSYTVVAKRHDRHDLANYTLSCWQSVDYGTAMDAGGLGFVLYDSGMPWEKLTYGTDYEISGWYRGSERGTAGISPIPGAPEEPGFYTVEVRGIGDCHGTARAEFSIWRTENSAGVGGSGSGAPEASGAPAEGGGEGGGDARDGEHGKLPNTVRASVAKRTLRASALKKRKKTTRIVVRGAKGKVTYRKAKKTGGYKKVSVSKKGKVTFKKGTKRGTYKFEVTAAGDAAYSAKTVMVKVRVV